MAGIIVRPMPRPRPIIAAEIRRYDVSACSAMKGRVVTSVTARPASATRPPPTRSLKRPASGIAIAAPMPCGMSSRPVVTASSPRTSWKYSGMMIIAPKRHAPRTKVVTAAALKDALRKRRTLSSGSSTRSAWTTKAATSTTPMASGP